jgi:hypothetical protein
MKTFKKVTFTKEEVEAITKAALLAAAASAIGTPGENEEWSIDISSYYHSTLEIVEKPAPEVAEVAP